MKSCLRMIQSLGRDCPRMIQILGWDCPSLQARVVPLRRADGEASASLWNSVFRPPSDAALLAAVLEAPS